MRRFFILLLPLIIAGCSLFEDDAPPKLNSAEFYESGDASFPVLAVDETETLFGFGSNLEKIYVRLPDGDEWLVKLKYNGYPESMFVQKGSTELLLVFSDFDEDKASVAVINQETKETNYFYDIEFDGISNLYGLKSGNFWAPSSLKSADVAGDIITWWDTYGEAVKKTVGPVLGGIGCGVSSITAVGSGGAATPIAVLSCGSFASSIMGDIIGESSDVGGALFKGGSVIGKYGEMILKCTSANWVQCTLGVAGEIGAAVNLFNYGISRSDTEEARQQMAKYIATGGLAGNWIGDPISAGSNTNQPKYQFGLHSGTYIQKSTQSAGGATSEVDLKMQFNYTLEDQNKISMTFVRITIVSKTISGGQTSTQELGPYSWNEFVNLAQHQGMTGYNSQTVTVNYEVKNNGQTLILDGNEFQREY